MANCLYSGDKPLGIVQSNAEDVAYDSNTSVKEKIDENNTQKQIASLLMPSGTYRFMGMLFQSGSNYLLTVYLPVLTSAMTVTSTEFRPTGQTAISVTPSINKEANAIIFYTSDSRFSSYLGKEVLCVANISYS